MKRCISNLVLRVLFIVLPSISIGYNTVKKKSISLNIVTDKLPRGNKCCWEPLESCECTWCPLTFRVAHCNFQYQHPPLHVLRSPLGEVPLQWTMCSEPIWSPMLQSLTAVSFALRVALTWLPVGTPSSTG